MNAPPTIQLVVEGPTDELIVQRVVELAGFQLGLTYGLHGKAHLLQRLASYNQAASLQPWLVAALHRLRAHHP